MKKRVFSWLMILMMVMTIVPVYGEGEPGSDPAPTIVVTPVAESMPEPKNEGKDDPKTEVKDEPKTEAEGEPKTEVKDEPKTEVEDEPKTEVKDEPKTEAEGEPETEVKDEPKTEVEEEPKAQATGEPKTATAGEPEAEPKGDDTEEPQATPVEPEKPSIDYDKTVAENELFDKGYVKLTGTAKVYERADAAEAYGEISRGVLYAIRRVNVGRSNERMEVAFATENGVKTAFVSAKVGKPMTDAAIDSFLKKMENVSAPHTYVDKSNRKFEVEILTLTVYAAEEEENASDAATPEATPVEPKPAATPAEAAPDEVKPVATPAEAAPDEVKPAATPAEAAPDEVKPVATPAEAAPDEVKPVATPAEATPIETKPEATPAEAANDQIDETRSEASDEDTRAAKIELTAARTEIGIGEKILLTAVVTDAEGTVLENATVTYVSSNAKAAAVSTKGEVSAAAVGEATITASVGSVKASVAFTVKAAPESLTLVPDSVMLGEGDTFELSCTLSANSAGAIVEWVSSAETIVSVENGVLTAKHAGTAVIRATLYNGVEGFCAVTVMAEPNDISLNPASMLLKEGETAELKAVFTGDVYGKVEFYVPESNDVVELVAKDGNAVKVHAKRSGKMIVSAKVVNHTTGEIYTDECEVTVQEAASQIERAVERTELGVGEILKLEPVVKTGRGNVLSETVKVTTSNKKIVAVNGTQIKGVKTGTADITLTTESGYKETIRYKVFKAPTKVTLSQTKAAMAEGDELHLSAKLPSDMRGAITWTCSPEDSMTISQDGTGEATFVAQSRGTVKLTAKTYNGKKATCTVTVTAKATGIFFENEEYSVPEKRTVQPTLKYLPEGATGKATYAIVEEEPAGESPVAEINAETGVVTALHEGRVKIQATVGELTAAAWVRVTPAISEIRLPVDVRLTIGLGEVYDLKPVAIDRTGAERSDVSVKLATSNKKYVAVNGTQVKGVKVGSATITITEGDCEPLKVKITVAKAPTKVTLSQTAATVSEGETLKLTAALPGSAGTVRWAVEDAKVLSIESMSDDTFTVEIRTLAKGKTRVKATSYDGKKSALCTITVADAPEGIVFGAAKYEIAQGLTRKPETVMLPATAKAAVQYELEDAAIASVDANGNVTALSQGATKLKATVVSYKNGTPMAISAETEIVVTPPYTEVKVVHERLVAVEGGYELHIGLNETVTLGAEVRDELSALRTEAAVTFATKNKKIAAISGAKLKGVKVGRTVLKATTENGVENAETITVVVEKAPTAVALDKKTAKLGLGEQLTLTAKITGVKGPLTWKTSNANVATVEDGVVTAKAVGTATITVSTYNKKTATCKLTVSKLPEGIKLNETQYTLYEFQTVTAKGTFEPANSYGTVKFEIDDPSVAIVDENGQITGLAAGTTKLHASVNGATAEAEIIVKPAAVRIDVLNAVEKLGVGEKVTLELQAFDAKGNDITADTVFEVKSANAKIASVTKSDAGIVVKGVKTGKTTVTIQAKNGAKMGLAVTVQKAPTAVKIAPESAKLAIGETVQLTGVTKSGETTLFTWKSSAENVATVDENGRVTALAEGETVITAAAFNGKSATCTITVCKMPESLAFASETYTVPEKHVVSTALTFAPEGAYASQVVYVIDESDAETAEVDENGVVKGLRAGEATLRVWYGQMSAETKIVVTPYIDQIVLGGGSDEYRTSIGVGEVYDLAPVAVSVGGEELDEEAFTLSTSNKRYVTVNGTQIKGVHTGSAKITITSVTDKTIKKTVTITVKKAPTSVTITPAQVTVSENATFELKGTTPGTVGAVTLTITKGEGSVIEQLENGAFRAIGIGEAEVVATAYNNKASKPCVVTVRPNANGIELENAEYRLSKGAKLTLAYHLSPENAFGEVAFEAVNGDIASVDAKTGVVTGAAVGKAEIRAKVYNYVEEKWYEATAVVDVTEPPAKVVITESRRVVGVGEKLQLNAISTDSEDGEILAAMTYKSKNSKIAKVSADGTVQGVKKGKTTITVTTTGGAAETVTITVVAAPTKVTLKPSSAKLSIGEQKTLEAAIPSGQSGTVTFTVKPEGIVEVDANGVVTAKAVGTATITAATHNGKKATCVVTVTEAPEEIRFSQSVYTVKEGEVLKLAPEMLPAGTYGTPAFELSYEDDEFELATIDENGSLKGQYSGSVTVKATVKNYNGGADATAICEVLVVPAPRTIELRETRTSIGVKEIMDLEPVAFDARGNEVEAAFTLKSGKTAYVQVNGTSVKGVKAGSASVTITADNGIKKSVTIKVVKEPSKVGISRASATISEMDTLRLAAAVPTGTQGKITWSSSHPEVATVDETGFVTAVAPGKTEIIAKAYNGKQASCALTVMNEPTGVAFGEPKTEQIGEGAKLKKKAELPEDCFGKITYSSYNPYVAIVNATTGEVIAKRAGTTRIAATTINRKTGEVFTDTYELEVTPAPVQVVIRQTRAKVGVGETMNLLAEAIDGSGEAVSAGFTYKTSNKAYVTVDANGNVKGVKKGSATITATAYNGKSASVKITVVAAPTAVKLNLSEVDVVLTDDLTQQVQLRAAVNTGASGFTWESSAPEIVTVDADGRLTGKALGDAVITVYTFNRETAKCMVHVKAAPESVTLDSEAVTIVEKLSTVLTATLNEGAAGSVSFEAEDPTVVTLTQQGNKVQVKGLKPGETVVTVKTFNGKTAQCTVTVKPEPESIMLSKASVTISVGQKYDMKQLVTLLPDDCMTTYTFATRSSAIAKIDANGIVTGVKIGSTEVKITTHNGKSAILSVKVMAAPKSVTLTVPNKVLYLNEETTGTVKLTANSWATWTVTSDRPEVVSVVDVNDVGQVTLKAGGDASAIGKATITVETDNGLKSSVTIEVRQHVESIELDRHELSLTHYDEAQLNATVLPETAYDKDVLWTSSDPTLVTVSQTGTLQAVGYRASSENTVTITAKTSDGDFEDTCVVTVLPKRVETITLAETEIELEKNRMKTLTATISPANADDRRIVWDSTDKSVATVDENGVVTAVSNTGTATITATTVDGNKVAECKVTATKVRIVSVSIDPASLEILQYREDQLIAKLEPADADYESIDWTSLREEVLSVTANEDARTATIRGLEVDDAIVKVVVTDSFGKQAEAECTVTVQPVPVTGVKLDKETLNMRTSAESSLVETVMPADAHDQTVAWESSDEEIVKVVNGVLTAGTKAGTAKITVITNDGGFKAECQVTVYEPLTVTVKANHEKNSTGNAIVWTVETKNLIGEVRYDAVTLTKDGTSMDVSRDGSVVTLENAAAGTYELRVQVFDLGSEGDTAEHSSTVIVTDSIEFQTDSAKFTYVIMEGAFADGTDGAAIKLADTSVSLSELTVPKTVNGVAVYRIDTEAFMGMSSLTSVSLPDTVVVIGARAFKNCTKLTKITSY